MTSPQRPTDGRAPSEPDCPEPEGPDDWQPDEEYGPLAPYLDLDLDLVYSEGEWWQTNSEEEVF